MCQAKNLQMTLFNDDKYSLLEKIIYNSAKSLTKEVKLKLDSYTLKEYINDIETQGIEKTWNSICDYVILYGENNDFLTINNFGEMYEIGLATSNKQSKKDNGQYYTPDDIAEIMSEWLEKLDGYNICDVACGTGKLILTFLNLIGTKEAIKLISEGRIYLYDLDKVALKICKTSIMIKYGIEYENKIHDIYCDFLDKNINLPKDSKVISNPPYAAISNIDSNWEKTEVLLDTKEFYSAFMEKMILQSKSMVIITPFSFISGTKFYSLRKLLEDKNGEIYSFDNVPGNIFCGRKHGIFNTNTSNSVRAAISVIKSNPDKRGFRLTPLIRFKATERKELLKCKKLKQMLSPKKQIISEKRTKFYKCFKELQKIYDIWERKSKGKTLKQYIVEDGKYIVSMPNTCRYYTTASYGKMNRNGQIVLSFNDKDIFNFVYCFINSSFAYWYWRLYDGGITYPKNLLLDLPMIYDLITEEDKRFFEETTNEMIKNEVKYKIIKNNVGIQENVKFPREYRDKINERIFRILNLDINYKIFDLIHSNMALEVSV